jgi:hypothetical protein
LVLADVSLLVAGSESDNLAFWQSLVGTARRLSPGWD